MVVDFSDNPVSHAKQVLRMVEQMQELLEYTLSQENQIVEESERQRDPLLSRKSRQKKRPSVFIHE